MKVKKLVTSALLSVALLSTSASVPQFHNVNASSAIVTVRSARLSHHQAKRQRQVKIMSKVRRTLHHHHSNWFRDGLSQRELRARGWIARHESGDHWDILSYGGVCVGYFQLNPHYLGYKHGRVNLNHKHQVKIADAYAKSRYGNWRHAKHFWRAHHWY